MTALSVLASAPAFADGEAVEHARQHAGGGVAGAIVAAAIAVAWRPRPFGARVVRLAAIGAFTLFGAAQAVESIGATGYDASTLFAENERSKDVHELGNAVTTLSLLFVMMAVGLAVATLVFMRARRRPARDQGAASERLV